LAAIGQIVMAEVDTDPEGELPWKEGKDDE